MLATPGSLLSVTGAPLTWAFEVKWDGMRILASAGEHGLRLVSRTGVDATERFPEVAATAGLPPDSLLDGEIVAFDEAGLPSFSRLAPRIQGRGPGAAAVTYLVFDLLRLRGVDLLDRSYDERRSLLLENVDESAYLLVPGSFDDGAALLESTAQQGLEGVVAKRRGSTYRPGTRSPDWVKIPHRRTQSYVIGGWKRGVESGRPLASVLVGTPSREGLLRYDGAVGSGLSERQSTALLQVLTETVRTSPPFETTELLSADVLSAVTWVEPLLVVDVEHLGRGGQGLLRAPSVVRLRPDLGADDIVGDGGQS
jgi:bifunctional non-homologous end joining protein LigD